MTVAQDKIAKVWEYGAEYREIISTPFSETPNCVAIHPLSI